MADLHANKAAGEKELAEAVAKAESVREVCVSPKGGGPRMPLNGRCDGSHIKILWPAIYEMLYFLHCSTESGE